MYNIIGSSLKRELRQFVKTNRALPISIVDGDSKPKLAGSYGGYFTKGGSPIYHPNAYSKSGWSNMVYERSTKRIEVSKSWIENYLNDKYAYVIYFGYKFYVRKSNLREIERLLSCFEKDIYVAPEDKKTILLSAALSIIPESYIIFCSKPEILSLKQAYKILGLSPVKISEKLQFKLQKDDASIWLTSNVEFPDHFLLNEVPWEYRNFVRKSEPEIIYWLLNILNNPNKKNLLDKDRTILGPHGEILKFNFKSKLDEIKSADLYNGINSGIKKVFERAAKRVANEKMALLKASESPLIKFPDWWPGDTDEWKLLRSAADLIREGETLQHCVAQYVGYVKRKESLIIAITGNDGSRSTVEMNPDTLEVVQHLSYKNSKPSLECQRSLERLISNINSKREFRDKNYYEKTITNLSNQI